MGIWKKAGYGLLAFVPVIGNLILQMGITMLAGIVIAVWMMKKDGGDSLLYYMAQSGTFILEHYMEMIIVVQLVGLAVFGLWYYLSFVRGKEKNDVKGVFGAKNLIAFLLIGLSFYLFINFYLESLYWIVPSAMAQYDALMNMSDVGGLTFASTIASMVLAPVGEEIVFRGLTYRYFRKAGVCFAVANVMQALLFGIYHLNWVQGSYAFLLALLLGYLYRRYHSLLVPMFLHMIFNFSGTYIATAIGVLPDNWILNSVLLMVAAVFLIAAMKLMGKQTPTTGVCDTSVQPIECTDTEALQSDRESEWK